MLQAFCDDSHSSHRDRPLFLAAYVLDAESWIRFSDAWDAILRAPPAIDYFKMVEATGRRGCFDGFSETDRNKKVFALANVIKEFGPWCFNVRVNTVEFESILKPYAPPPFRTPYFALCYAIMHGIVSLHEGMQMREPCEFIFDDHPGLAAKVLPIFDFMLDERPDWAKLIAGKPSFKDDKTVPPLQACDMLAWAIRRTKEGVAAKDFDGLIDKIAIKELHFANDVSKETMESVAEMWKQNFPDAGEMHKRDWDAMMVRLHNSRALAIWMASR